MDRHIEKKAVKTFNKIVSNYQSVEQSLVHQLTLETPGHQPTTGTYRENVWLSLFEQIIPRKFCIDQGVFVIDSFGGISNEIDLAIYDEQYTPYIFNYGKIKFIPIEAVAVVVQCKGKQLSFDNLNDWIGSIRKLKTSLDSVARIMPGVVDNNLDWAYRTLCEEPDSKRRELHLKSQTSTRPVTILCSTKGGSVSEDISGLFDITLNIGEKSCLKKTIPHQNQSNDWWYEQLNHWDLDRYDDKEKYMALKKSRPQTVENPDDGAMPEKGSDRKLKALNVERPDGTGENVMLSLTFQLNQLLMLINNPMLFPHIAYARRFNEMIKLKKMKDLEKVEEQGQKRKKRGEKHEQTTRKSPADDL